MDRLMHALRVHGTRDPGQLRYEEAPVPVPAIGEVLVRVAAASFVPTELSWPSTSSDRAGRNRLPTIPAHEVSGVVEGLGYGTTGWDVGDRVFGMCDWYRDGAAAEYVAVEARNLAAKPSRWSDTDTASVPLAGLTAWQALLTHGRLAGGETVLVTGAAGGVGVYAVQLARCFGGRVIGAGHAQQEAVVRELGAHEFVDLDRDDWVDIVADVDVAFDLVGARVLDQLTKARRDHTRVVTVVEPRDGAVFFVVEPDRPTLTELARMIDAGDLRPVVGAVTPLSQAATAFAQKGGVTGKSVLEVSSVDALGANGAGASPS
jgi:NADPH:quinone reductase-like Zn-dependent oxidoreductase